MRARCNYLNHSCNNRYTATAIKIASQIIAKTISFAQPCPHPPCPIPISRFAGACVAIPIPIPPDKAVTTTLADRARARARAARLITGSPSRNFASRRCAGDDFANSFRGEDAKRTKRNALRSRSWRPDEANMGLDSKRPLVTEQPVTSPRAYKFIFFRYASSLARVCAGIIACAYYKYKWYPLSLVISAIRNYFSRN